MTRLVMLAAASLLAASPAAAEPPPQQQLSFAAAIALCHEAYFGNADKAKALLRALKSAEERRSVALLCIAYGAGAQALEDNLVAQREARNRT